MKKLIVFVYTGCLLLLLGGGMLLLYTAPREATPSETENRMLEAFPAFNKDTVLSGDFFAAFERYLSDRFFLRDRWIDLAKTIQERLSLLSGADRVKLAAMDTVIDEAEPEPVLPSAAPSAVPQPETTPSAAPEATPSAEPKPTASPTPSATPGEAAFSLTRLPTTPTPAAGRTPLYEYTQTQDTDTRAAVSIKLRGIDGSETEIAQYRKWHIEQGASLFNRLLSLLPEDGHMYVVMAQRGEHVFQYTMGLDKYTAYVSEVEDYLEPLLDERITLFRAMDILEPHIRAGEYVYFMTDHHWTVRGAYYVHKAMVEAQGLRAVPLEDYVLTRQQGYYRGQNYNTVAGLLPKDARDYVEQAEPGIPYTFYRVNDITELTEMPLNDPKEGGYQAILWLNMRPWKLIRTYENTGRKMLLVCDSMGMAFAPFMACYYDEVHIVRPHETYYSTAQAGGTIRAYIEHYGIEDIYVVQSNFFTGDLYRKTLSVSIGDGK